MSTLFDPDRGVPVELKAGPFLSVFVVHNIADPEAYDRYQSLSDGQSLKPKHFGGTVLGFSKPVFKFLGPEEAHAVAVIRWPNFEAFKAWRTQDVYSGTDVAELHAKAERESVFFLPCLQN